jgi:hypothetical protein
MFGAAAARLGSGVSDPGNLWTAAGIFSVTVLGLWCTWYELRNLARRQSNLQRILDDFGSAPGAPI